ncbi:hypothetical protein HanIR_Chr15g0770511 [Helianthus annuus]|nr:hypothetical protein HanIR_Chr15g0770511 [Helianthus annuus]
MNRMFLSVFYNILRSHGHANKVHDRSLLNYVAPYFCDISIVDWSSRSHDRSLGRTTVHLRVRAAQTLERVVHYRTLAEHRNRTGCNQTHARASPGKA